MLLADLVADKVADLEEQAMADLDQRAAAQHLAHLKQEDSEHRPVALVHQHQHQALVHQRQQQVALAEAGLEAHLQQRQDSGQHSNP
jgi:hypothetical protein